MNAVCEKGSRAAVAPSEASVDRDAALAAECRARADMYGLVARAYRTEADEELLDRLGKIPATAADDGSDIGRGLSLMSSYAASAWEGTLTELAVDYVRTFIGNGVDGHEAAYPFESVYTSEKHLMMQDARDEVLAIYLSEGLARSSEWKVGEDHVALEFEFMQTLAARTADALEAGDRQEARRLVSVQRNFLHDHIANWVGRLASDMRSCSRTDFYRGLAWVTDGLVAADAEYLRGV